MPAVRMKRSKIRETEQQKVVGALCLLGLAACAAAFDVHAAAFTSAGVAAPLAGGASRPLTSTSFPAQGQAYAQMSVSSTTLAACAAIAVAAAARSALAGRRLAAASRKGPSAVVRCASAPLASAPAAPQPVFSAPAAPATPLIELSTPVASLLAEPCFAAAPVVTGRSTTYDMPMPTIVTAAAAPAEEGHAVFASSANASTTARAAFAGARAARVIGGVRYASSRQRSQGRSSKSIRCYVAQQFPEVVPLKLAYDPSRLSGKMQAGVQVMSRMRQSCTREGTISAASMNAGLFSGANDLIYRTMIQQQGFNNLA
eukprot:TRINITY_DN2306_c0_g1_i1.p1 TRINITY_DN2306_c0_g1~~TRINITY_DN2306_c0_g1_i1.p1  ORF type:complete len:315 (+),score=78.90 TRINITY_DN2306_c0_g1_i1:105-1049(+)